MQDSMMRHRENVRTPSSLGLASGEAKKPDCGFRFFEE